MVGVSVVASAAGLLLPLSVSLALSGPGSLLLVTSSGCSSGGGGKPAAVSFTDDGDSPSMKAARALSEMAPSSSTGIFSGWLRGLLESGSALSLVFSFGGVTLWTGARPGTDHSDPFAGASSGSWMRSQNERDGLSLCGVEWAAALLEGGGFWASSTSRAPAVWK